MPAHNVLSVFNRLRQRHTLSNYVMHALIAKMSVLGFAPSHDVMVLQSLLAACDQSTNAHAQRVMFLVEEVAHQLQLSEDEIFLTCLAALLHDVGKAGIPEAILKKPGPLDEHELQVMRRHTEIGQQMLLQAGSIFVQLGPMVVAHHERWDGGGYPVGLVGEEIPLAARIITVVDSYDVMIRRRVYHEAQSVAEACAELQRCAGSQFDPHIVAVFLSLLEELPSQHERSRRIPAAGEAQLVGVMFAVPSLRSDECVPVSA